PSTSPRYSKMNSRNLLPNPSELGTRIKSAKPTVVQTWERVVFLRLKLAGALIFVPSADRPAHARETPGNPHSKGSSQAMTPATGHRSSEPSPWRWDGREPRRRATGTRAWA